MKPIVFIHTNDKQLIGAKVAEYSLKKNTKYPNEFETRIICLEEVSHLYRREGMSYLRKGHDAVWHNNDLQSFSPLRMLIPQLMNFKGRALVIDPDVFAVGDVWELLSRDMQNKAIYCRHIKDGYKNNGNSFFASSVMLLDCEKLKHWQWDRQIDQIFNKVFDYGDWIALRYENPKTIGLLEDEWNHFDTLNQNTKLLHNTERSTQPWKFGLPVDYDTNVKNSNLFKSFFFRFFSFLKLNNPPPLKYLAHPDPNQEFFFLKLLKECLEHNYVTYDLLEKNIKEKNIRADILLKLKDLG
jgi:hypothetical protein